MKIKLLTALIPILTPVLMLLTSCDSSNVETSNTNEANETPKTIVEVPKDDCEYSFKFQVNPDKLALIHASNHNQDMRNGTLEVFNGVLDLTKHGLELIPAEVVQQECIKEIILEKNSIRQFPKELLKMEKLEKIDISNNTLLEFPSIATETDLKVLKLSGNQIKSISGRNLLKFKNLEYLYLKGNESISELPDEILELKNLKALDIRQTKLAKSYAKVTKLRKEMPDTQIFYFSK